MGYFSYLQMIEYFRLNIEYLRSASGAINFIKTYQRNDGAKRLPQIFNSQYSIVNSGLSASGGLVRIRVQWIDRNNREIL